MSDLREEQLESLLRRHMHGRLDAQLGKSAQRFRQFLANADAPKVLTPKRSGWIFPIGLVGAAIAAAVTFAVLQRDAVPPTVNRLDPTPVQTVQYAPVVRDAKWRTTDEGVIELNDGSQAQVLTRERMDRLKWYDPKSDAYLEYRVPRKETVLIGLNRY